MFTQLITRLLLTILLIQSTLWPAQATAAVVDIHGTDRTWDYLARWSDHWPSQPVVQGQRATVDLGIRVNVPKDNWAEIANGPWDQQHGFDPALLRVPEWAAHNNPGVARNLPDGMDYSNRKIPLDTPYVQVWASYDPYNAVARILVQKAELGLDNRVHVYVADWTPWHGRDWQKVRAFLTPSEKDYSYGPGYSPFQAFQADPNAQYFTTTNNPATRDPLWRNISFEALQVAVGLAMQHYRAPFGLIYIPETRFDQNQSCSSGFFKRKCTTTVTGYAKPRWYLALPKSMDSQPIETGYCVVPTGAQGCDAAEHAVFSGISVREWRGGNLPVDEEQLYQWSQTKGGFTVLGIGIVLGVLTMGMALAAGFPMIGSGSLMSGQWGAAYTGYQIGSGYVTLNQIGGEGSNEIVSGLTNVRDGVQRPNLDGQSEQARGLAAAVAPKMQAGVISPNTMIGARKMAYGTCPPGAVCSAPDTGLAMRPKSYRRQAIPKTLLEARAMCEGQGLRLQSLDRCMARMNMLMTQQR